MAIGIDRITPAQAVARFFQHLRQGEANAALNCWAPNALWHVTGRSARAGDYSLADYLALCRQWYVDFPDYRAEFGDPTEVGELVFFAVRSRNGEAPGETEGVMLYRVVAGVITEGWALPARHGDRYTF